MNFLHVVQTGFGAHPASYPIGIGTLSSGVKRPGHEAGHSPPTSAEIKKMWIYTSLPHTSSWRGAELVKHKVSKVKLFL
jgi:hypothetical protein